MGVGEDGDEKDDRLLKRRGVSSGKEVRRGSDEQSTHLYDPVEVVTRGTSREVTCGFAIFRMTEKCYLNGEAPK